MNVIIGTPERMTQILTDKMHASFPTTPREIQEKWGAIGARIVRLSAHAFVSPLDNETIVLVQVSESETVHALSHEAYHVALNKIGEPVASKRLDLLRAIGREI